MISLGAKIREIREAKEIPLRDLAHGISVSPSYISDVERGNRNPTNAKLKDIAKYLNVPLADLDAYDTRPPLELFRARTIPNPGYSFAMRKLLESEISPDTILAFVGLYNKELEKGEKEPWKF